MNGREIYLRQLPLQGAKPYKAYNLSTSDINADVYVRSHDTDPRLEIESLHIRPRTIIARLEHECLLRMPRTLYLLSVMTYTGIVLACGILSKKNNVPNSPNHKHTNSHAVKLPKRESGSSGSSHSQTVSWSFQSLRNKFFDGTLEKLFSPFSSNFWETVVPKEPGISSAILSSCFHLWNSTKETNVTFTSETKSEVGNLRAQAQSQISGNEISCGKQDDGSASLCIATNRRKFSQSCPPSTACQYEHRSIDQYAAKRATSLYRFSFQKKDTHEDCSENHISDSPRAKSNTDTFANIDELSIPIARHLEDLPKHGNPSPASAFLSPFLEIRAAFIFFRQRLNTLVYQETKKGQSKRYLPAKLSARPLVSQLVDSLVINKSQKVVFDDASSSVNQISPVQLLSLLLLPEACV